MPTWPSAELHINTRAQGLLLAAWLGLLAAGLLLLTLGFRNATSWLVVTGVVSAFVATVGVIRGALNLRKPRLRIEQDHVCINLSRQPTRVPIDAVECFFLGQGPSGIPSGTGESLEASNVIVRLAEAAQDWHHRDVKPALGHWCEGYITVRGAWCEPISLELVNRLNHHLAEIKREEKGSPRMTRLMVSVRDPQEAEIAIQSGAEMIDIKEPARGPLGAADAETIHQIAGKVNRRYPVSVALGELSACLTDISGIAGLAYAKIGLADMRDRPDWIPRWKDAIDTLPDEVTPVAVAYVDADHAPLVSDIVGLARDCGCGAILLDTYFKNTKHLFDSISVDEVLRLMETAHQHALQVVLAGSLRTESIRKAVELKPFAVAVRGAVCAGPRDADIDAAAVRRVRASIDDARREAYAGSRLGPSTEI